MRDSECLRSHKIKSIDGLGEENEPDNQNFWLDFQQSLTLRRVFWNNLASLYSVRTKLSVMKPGKVEPSKFYLILSESIGNQSKECW